MAGPYTSDELATFSLNGANANNHEENSETPLLEMAINKCQSNLSYFHRQILRRMLAWEAEERPTFIELKEIFNTSAQVLKLNFDNEAFVEGLLKDKINDKHHNG